MQVVVSEDGRHGDLEIGNGVGQDPGLVRLADRGQVAGEQDEVGVLLDTLKSCFDPFTRRL